LKTDVMEESASSSRNRPGDSNVLTGKNNANSTAPKPTTDPT
jgi:hypothetical protein